MKSEIKITDQQIQITRVFDASRERVFAAWKRPELLERWSGCSDSTKVTVTMDFRVGGSFTQTMNITGAGEYTITGQYDEIVEPEKIVYHVNLGPATTRVTVEFLEVLGQDKHTKVVLTQEGFLDPKLCQVVSQGTSESFEKLAELLASQAASAN
jgi:uncharacterized protein YndB with AHSA1/START domain